MNRIILIIAIFILNIIDSAPCLAQTNSVQLQDGLGNLISSHSSIQDAYDAIPATVTQAYRIELSSTYDASMEVFPVTFVNKPGADANNFIKIALDAAIITLNINYDGSLSSAFIFDDADHVSINGRNANGGNGLRINSPGATLNFPSIQFINGTCNSAIDSCTFTPDFLSTNPAPVISFGTSPMNISGNSNDRVHGCIINRATLNILSEGTLNNPNANNSVTNNFMYTTSNGISLKQGTGKMSIDSNMIAIQHTFSYVERCAIVAEDVSDSLMITRNRLRIYLDGPSIPYRGITIRSTTGNNAYTWLVNNFVYFQSYDNRLGMYTDQQTDIAGIEYNAIYPIKADIYHNTVRVMEQLADTVAGPSTSACFKKTGSDPGSIFNIKNNIFSMERYGGNNVEHMSMQLDNTSGILNIDHNTYHNVTSQYVKYNNTLYGSFAAYQAAIGSGNEVNSNSIFPDFTGPTDFHVYGNSVNNPFSYGIALPGITIDLDGDTRTNPYKGCDEYVLNCTPGILQIYNPPTSVCYGDSFLFYTSFPYYGNGNTWQWQSRPAGTTGPFMDIPGASHYTYIVKPIQSTEYRVKRSCIDNSYTNYSQQTTVIVNPLPSASGISEWHTGLQYHFSATNPLNTTLFVWDHGDGSAPDSSALPVHTYPDTGTYTVMLILFNNCGSDTITFIMNIVLSVGDVELAGAISVYPNPANDAVTILSPTSAMNEITIYNITGMMVRSEHVIAKDVKINTSSLSTGLYLLRVNTDNGTVYKQLQVLK